MFREMRLKKQLLDKEKKEEILKINNHLTLALIGDNGYPYSLPIGFVYINNLIYIHCANEGYKLDCIKKNSRISFSIVDKDNIVPKKFNSLFVSLVAFGKAEIVTTATEKDVALKALLDKYSSGFQKNGQEYVRTNWDNVTVVKIHIDHITGKKGVE